MVVCVPRGNNEKFTDKCRFILFLGWKQSVSATCHTLPRQLDLASLKIVAPHLDKEYILTEGALMQGGFLCITNFIWYLNDIPWYDKPMIANL